MNSSACSTHIAKKNILINYIVPQSKKLFHDFVRLTPQPIVVHGISDKLLAVSDLGRPLLRQIVIDVHVIDVSHRVYRDFVVLELMSVVEVWPVVDLGDYLRSLAQLAKLGEVFKHVFVNLQA